MCERWSDELAAEVKEWCDIIAGLGIDALIDAGLVDKRDNENATAVLAEEIFARLCLHDYPPSE
jgi:hypothetical protein